RRRYGFVQQRDATTACVAQARRCGIPGDDQRGHGAAQDLAYVADHLGTRLVLAEPVVTDQRLHGPGGYLFLRLADGLSSTAFAAPVLQQIDHALTDNHVILHDQHAQPLQALRVEWGGIGRGFEDFLDQHALGQWYM